MVLYSIGLGFGFLTILHVLGTLLMFFRGQTGRDLTIARLIVAAATGTLSGFFLYWGSPS